MASVVKFLGRALLVGLVAGGLAGRAGAEALLLIDADSGKVLQAENATYPWYPASLSKLMTTYVVLQAVKDGRISLDTLITVSPNAVMQAPSKMGLRAGVQLTVDNGIKMMLVHSANDLAVVLAEGVAGSIDKFSDEMNATAQRLGMTQSSWVNPNGLPAEGQITSARDLGILARALIRDFPQYDFYWHIPAIKFGRRVITNTNRLLAQYPGSDGMKTGFICASGFNLIATATRDNRRLIAIVLGAPSSAARATKAASMLEQGFNSGSGLSWLLPSLGTVESLQPINAAPPDLHDEICGNHRRKHPPAEDEDDEAAAAPGSDGDNQRAFMLSDLKGSTHGSLLTGNPLVAATPPMVVYTGAHRPTGTGEREAEAASFAPAKKHAKHGPKAAAAKPKTDEPKADEPKTAEPKTAKPPKSDKPKPDKTAQAKVTPKPKPKTPPKTTPAAAPAGQ